MCIPTIHVYSQPQHATKTGSPPSSGSPPPWPPSRPRRQWTSSPHAGRKDPCSLRTTAGRALQERGLGMRHQTAARNDSRPVQAHPQQAPLHRGQKGSRAWGGSCKPSAPHLLQPLCPTWHSIMRWPSSAKMRMACASRSQSPEAKPCSQSVMESMMQQVVEMTWGLAIAVAVTRCLLFGNNVQAVPCASGTGSPGWAAASPP